MHIKSLISIATSLTLLASQVAAIEHGEQDSYDGKPIRWHQLAKDVYRGVPAGDWDDKVHTKGDEDWQLEQFYTEYNATAVDARSLPVDDRAVSDICYHTIDAFQSGGKWLITTGWSAWLLAADRGAAQIGLDLWTFLNQPFVHTSLGVGIGGIISNGANGAGTSVTAECSEEQLDRAMLDQIIQSTFQARPDANYLEIGHPSREGVFTIRVESCKPGERCQIQPA